MNSNNTGKQGRCFHFVQYYKNPRTGEKLLDDDYEIKVKKDWIMRKVSKALGHNRLEVVANNYIRGL